MSPTPRQLHIIINDLLAARERHLIHRPVQDILTSIGAVIARFLDPTSSERQEAETVLPEETGLSSEMVRHTLPLIFQEYQPERLQRLLDTELGTSAVLDQFQDTLDGSLKACGPRLITHVLAGNLPGAGIDEIIFSLLVKSATLVKTASSSASLQTLFARSLARHDLELGSCLALVTWPGGQTKQEELAFSEAEIVMASGSDESLAAIRQRVRGRFIGYGHKISFSVMTHEALTEADASANKAAYDVALFDQHGCLSPQLVYVEENGPVTPRAFAALLAKALEDWQTRLPRGQVSPAVSTELRRVRDEAEWRALAGKESVVHAGAQGTEWTVIYEADLAFSPSPLYRTVRVKPLASLDHLDALLVPWRPYLEAVGTVVPTDQHRRQTLLKVLGHSGMSRICPIGTMQTPPLSWRHGGRLRLAELVHWVGVERKRAED